MPTRRALSAEAKSSLDSLISETAASRAVPVIFAGVATAHEILYLSQAGDRVFEEPEKGQVDEDTSACFTTPLPSS